jgi:phosphatidylinositol alpha-1,6-mannosyltransferase
MGKKNIFIFSTEFPPGPGGIGSHAYQIAKELHRLGWDVKVFSEQAWATEEEIATYNRVSPFKIYRLFPTPSILSLIAKFFRLFFVTLYHRPKIVFGSGKHAAWFAVLIGKFTFRKSVVAGHGTEFIVTASPRSRSFNNWIYSSADAIIHVSAFTRKISESAGVKNKNPVVIHNGADNELFYRLNAAQIENFKRQKGVLDKRVIVTVGNVQLRKGQEWVIRAMPAIIKQVPNAHYYCVGQATTKPRLEAICGELGVEEHVHFTDKVPLVELLNWLNAADVFAMTSIVTDYGDVEGFGIAVVEAALCGAPAVVTGSSGPGEAIVQGETGLEVEEKNTSDIAEKIIRLLQNEELRKKMGEKAMTHALQERTWSIAVKKYDHFFTGLI